MEIRPEDLYRTDDNVGTEFPGQKELPCPECNSPMRLRISKHGPFYGCSAFPKCDCTHGAKPDGSPMGRPANKETRIARKQAHAIFDRIWQTNLKRRHEAYAWLGKVMGLSKQEAHISMMTKAQCEKLIQHVLAQFPKTQSRHTRLAHSDLWDDT